MLSRTDDCFGELRRGCWSAEVTRAHSGVGQVGLAAAQQDAGVQRVVRRPARRRLDGPLDQALGDARCEQRVACCVDPDRRCELVGARALEPEPARARPQRLVHVVVRIERRQHQHAWAVALVPLGAEQLARRGQSVEHGHAHVHEDKDGGKLIVPAIKDAPDRVSSRTRRPH